MDHSKTGETEASEPSDFLLTFVFEGTRCWFGVY